MGIQLFPVLEGYDTSYFLTPNSSFDWKSLPYRLEELDDLAKQLGVEPLGNFIDVTRDDYPFDEEELDEIASRGEVIGVHPSFVRGRAKPVL